jgi:hypothetical protein
MLAANRGAPGSHKTPGYGLLYRNCNHGGMKSVCETLNVPVLSKTLQQQLGRSAVSEAMRDFAGWFAARNSVSIVVEQDPVRRPVQIIVLPRPQRPQERRQPECCDHQADHQQKQNDRHASVLPCKRRLFAITSSDELDIAAAASQGVTQPQTASGTINTL